MKKLVLAALAAGAAMIPAAASAQVRYDGGYRIDDRGRIYDVSRNSFCNRVRLAFRIRRNRSG